LTARVRLTAHARRAQIIDEATRLIGERGYYGFTLQQVADACGVTVAGVLHHAGTKERLLLDVVEERDRRDEAWLRRREADTPAVSLAGSMTLLHDLVVRNSEQPEIVRLYTMLRAESLLAEHPAHDFFDQRDRRAVAQLTEMLDGLIADPRSTARQLFAWLGGFEEQWLRDPTAFDLVGEWDRAVVALLGVRPGEE